jgi:DNA-binding CsgD family transcriptional regulator
LSLITPPENVLGEETAKFKLTIRENASVADKKSWDYFWYLCNLTKRERQLIEILGKGERVVDFQTHYGIAKATAHMHWQNVKFKTGVTDRAEISFAYQTFINKSRSPKTSNSSV